MKLATTLFAAFVALGCSSSSSNSSGPDSSEDYAAISKLDIKAAVALVNEWRDTKPEITSSVTQQELDVKFPDGRELKMPLPAAETYVAVAPYIQTTHTCSTHYPSKCQGEMKSTAFRVTTKDETGALLFDGNATSLKNGFFELWLPRGKTINVHIVQGSLAVDASIPTASDSPTCVSTAQLK